MQDGDIITIDVEQNKLNVEISDEELASRKARWSAPPYKVTKGALYKYIKTVSPASQGCVTDA